MSICLETNKNGELSIDTDLNPVKTPLPLTDADKDIEMLIRRINLYSALPRGLVVGTSTIEHVKDAYTPGSGLEFKDMEHFIVFSYYDFDKLAKSTERQIPDIPKLKYYFADDILVAAIMYF
jgi:hypothetical protein